MTRIRYTRTTQGFETNWIMVGPNLILKGLIEGELFSIINTEKKVLTVSRAKSIRHAKSEIRRLLIACGLILDGEIRVKRTTP